MNLQGIDRDGTHDVTNIINIFILSGDPGFQNLNDAFRGPSHRYYRYLLLNNSVLERFPLIPIVVTIFEFRKDDTIGIVIRRSLVTDICEIP